MVKRGRAQKFASSTPQRQSEATQQPEWPLLILVGRKLRYRGVEARGVCVWVTFNKGSGFSRDKRMMHVPFYTEADVWQYTQRLFDHRPKHMVIRTMGMYLYELTPSGKAQLSLFDDTKKSTDLDETLDEINNFWGDCTVITADMLTGRDTVKQKIPFGGIEYFDLLLKRA